MSEETRDLYRKNMSDIEDEVQKDSYQLMLLKSAENDGFCYPVDTGALEK